MLALIGFLILLIPIELMSTFEWEIEDPTLARASSAGLLAMAVLSLKLRDISMKNSPPYLFILSIWNGTIALSFLVSIISIEYASTWKNITLMIISFIFTIIWAYYNSEISAYIKRKSDNDIP